MRILSFLLFVWFVSCSLCAYEQRKDNSTNFTISYHSLKKLEKRADIVLKDGKVGLSKHQLILAFHFIETKTDPNVHRYTVHESRLPCLIERSDLLQGYLIRSIQNRDASIGRGYFKTVNKVILYGKNPKVLAESSAPITGQQELDILEQVRGGEGIPKYYGYENKRNKIVFYHEYFPQGSLGGLIKKNIDLSPSQIAELFLEIAKGLRTLHEKGIVHRDIQEGNVLVDITPEKCRAVLIDFNLSAFANKVHDSVVQGYFRKCPPEPLVCDLTTIDKYAVDMYAFGALLYHVIWKQMHLWADVYNIYKFSQYSPVVRQALYDQIVSLYTASKEKDIGFIIKKVHGKEPLTTLEKLQILSYQMMDVIPENRPKLAYVISVLEDFLSKGSENNSTLVLQS